MTALQDDIARKFIDALTESKEVEAHIIDKLRTLLADGKKPKVDELVKIFTALPDAEVK